MPRGRHGVCRDRAPPGPRRAGRGDEGRREHVFLRIPGRAHAAGGGEGNLGDGAGAAAGEAGEADVLRHGEAAVGRAGGVAGGRDEEAAAGALAEDDGEAAAGGEEEAGERVEEGGAALELRSVLCGDARRQMAKVSRH